MKSQELNRSLSNVVPDAKRRAFSRRSVLTVAGTLGAAAPFGIFGAARALTASGVGSLPYIPGEFYLPHRGERRRAAGAAPPAQTRLECECGLHGRGGGRKGTRYLRQA